jgi:subfamily B ATP-binding cassette protein MsbA
VALCRFMKLNFALRTIFRLFKYARKYWLLVVVCLGFMGAYAALSQGRLLLLKPLVDNGLKDTEVSQKWPYLLNIILIVLGMSVFVAVFDYVNNFLQRYIVLRVIADVRNHLCKHILGLSMNFFNRRKAGDLISRVTNDIGMTQAALDFLFGDIVLMPMMILGAMGAAFYLCWQLALVSLIVVPLFGLVIVKFGRKTRKSRLKSLVILGDVTEAMHQMFTGIRIVKAFRMEDEEAKQFADLNQDFVKKSMGVVRAKALSSSLFELLNAILVTVAFIAGLVLLVNKLFPEVTAGTFVAFLLAMISINRPAKVLGKSYNMLQESLAGCERVFEILDLKAQVQDAPDAVELEGVRSSVKFDNVSFAYETAPVVRDFTLEARFGEIVALVGPSGAGKSTLMDLVARFYDPTIGAIYVDGHDLRKIKRDSLMRHLAVVSQETFLFNTTIAENIRYGKREAKLEEIIEAAKAANLHDFIETLPGKYETVVGERGAKLSGGQRQRVAIARAILKNPEVLLLDEATSALDTESERAVQAALDYLMHGRLTFVIAHRLSTVQHADRIIVLEDGRMVELGRHDELMKNDGLYAKLYRMQFESHNGRTTF